MFRKSKHPQQQQKQEQIPSSTTILFTEAEEDSRKFFQMKSFVKSDSCEAAPVSFSIGEKGTPAASKKNNSIGLFSRLFKRKSIKIPEIIITDNTSDSSLESQSTTATGKRKSLWQRSKSIMRRRDVLDRSDSTVLELPNLKNHKLNILGSGSAAQLLLNEFPINEFYTEQYGVDTDGLLSRIFENNHLIYEQLLLLHEEKRVVLEGMLTPVLTNEGVFLPLTKSEIDEPLVLRVPLIASHHASFDELEKDSNSESHPYHHSSSLFHFDDNLKLDSPLEDDNEERYNEEYENEVNNENDNAYTLSLSYSESLSTSIQSYLDASTNGPSLAEIPQMSLDEIAEMFDLMTVGEPQTLQDGTLRYICENEETGSAESIQFKNNWATQYDNNENGSSSVLRKCKSSDSPTLTGISIFNQESGKTEAGNEDEEQDEEQQQYNAQTMNPQIQKQPLTHTSKLRSFSLAQLSSIVSSPVSCDRRRSFGAKVSRIVALFEGGSEGAIAHQ